MLSEHVYKEVTVGMERMRLIYSKMYRFEDMPLFLVGDGEDSFVIVQSAAVAHAAPGGIHAIALNGDLYTKV